MSILGLDVGTSGSKAIVIDEKGKILARSQGAYGLLAPSPGHLEIDPDELWNCLQRVIRECSSMVSGDPISVVSISTMGDSFVPVGRQNEPVGNFILASDVRSTRETQMLIGEIGYERIFRITGMPPHPINTLTKIFWMKNNDPDTFERASRFLCAEEYVVSRLGLPPTTSYSNACRTMAFDIAEYRWSTEMMDVVGVGKDVFPVALPSGEVVGEIPPAAASPLNLGRGVRVISGGIDQACSALGSKAIHDGHIEDSIGTVEALSFTVDEKLRDRPFIGGLLNGHYSVNCHVISGKFLIMALVLSAGSILRWFCEELGEYDGARDLQDLLAFEKSPEPTRLILLPYFAGSGTPGMNPLSKGIIMGLDLGIKKEDLIKAILQGIVHEVSLNLDYLEKVGVPLREIRCVGGGSKSDFWLQMRADMLGRKVIKMRDSEAAVLGAAIIAGSGGGVWGSVEEAMECVVKDDRIFAPRERYRQFYQLQKEIYLEMRGRTDDLFRRYADLLEGYYDLRQ